MSRASLGVVVLLFGVGIAPANPPVASYIFPAGGQRGQAVDIRVGGLFLYRSCGFEMLGPGVRACSRLEQAETRWFEGPLLPLPDSQQAEDYPRAMAGRVEIAADAPLGVRYWRLWTSEGATPSLKFLVGDLPEVVEQEVEGEPIPVSVQLPVTINGRIFPREDVDVWTFEARRGQTVCCEVHAAQLGSPLDSRLEVLDASGRRLAENDDGAGADSVLRFTAPADGRYQVRIHDISFKGGPAYVYRLTLSSGPRVEHVYPLGGRRGSQERYALIGQGLPPGPVSVAIPAQAPTTFAHRLTEGDQATNSLLLDVDDLPEHREAEPNDAPGLVEPVTAPAMLNGRVDQAGDADHWAFMARKGEQFELDLRAGRLGSPLHPVLVVLDAAGKQLARAEDPAADPVLRFTAPAEGTYVLQVTSRFRTEGGPGHAYRLRLAAPRAPDYHLHLASDALTLLRGGEAKLKIQVERVGGFNEAITLAVEGLPEGVTVTGTSVATGKGTVDLTFKADARAAIRPSRLTIRGTAAVGGRPVVRTAVVPAPRGMPEIDSVLLGVGLRVPFKVIGEYTIRLVPRGTVYHRRYRIERGGYEGPLRVALADRQMRHLQGVTGPTLSVPPTATEFDYPLTLPPWMELGRTCRACVMAVGVLREPDGSEHEVSFSSTAQNEQIVAVVEPGRLGIEAARSSVAARPGHSVPVPVRVARAQSLGGPVRVELVAGPEQRGIAAEPVVIPAGQDQGVLTLRFATTGCGPFRMPLVIRATLMENGDPVTAEAQVEIETLR